MKISWFGQIYELISHTQHMASELANGYIGALSHMHNMSSLTFIRGHGPFILLLSLSPWLSNTPHTHSHSSQSVEEMWVYINAPNYLGLHFSGHYITSDLAGYIFISDTPLDFPSSLPVDRVTTLLLKEPCWCLLELPPSSHNTWNHWPGSRRKVMVVRFWCLITRK